MNELENVKVGDMVGSVRIPPRGQEEKWTGALHPVTKVSAKRFMICGSWHEKSTGREVGRRGSSYRYILATPAMIAEDAAKKHFRVKEETERRAFQDRPDYKDASAICYLLSEMNPDNNPLDKLTPAEWVEFRKKLGA